MSDFREVMRHAKAIKNFTSLDDFKRKLELSTVLSNFILTDEMAQEAYRQITGGQEEEPAQHDNIELRNFSSMKFDAIDMAGRDRRLKDGPYRTAIELLQRVNKRTMTAKVSQAKIAAYRGLKPNAISEHCGKIAKIGMFKVLPREPGENLNRYVFRPEYIDEARALLDARIESDLEQIRSDQEVKRERARADYDMEKIPRENGALISKYPAKTGHNTPSNRGIIPRENGDKHLLTPITPVEGPECISIQEPISASPGRVSNPQRRMNRDVHQGCVSVDSDDCAVKRVLSLQSNDDDHQDPGEPEIKQTMGARQ